MDASRPLLTRRDVEGAEDSRQMSYLLYPKRFVALALFCALSFVNAAMWIQFASVSDLVGDMFRVSPAAVDWLSMTYMVCYMVGIYPATLVLEAGGLRLGLCLGALLNFAGAVLRFAGCAERSFGVLLVGQTVAGVAQVFVLGVPPILAARWFGVDGRASATAIAVLANPVGSAAGLLGAGISRDAAALTRVCLFVAVACAGVLASVALLFEEAPPTPPSASQERRRASSADLLAPPAGDSALARARARIDGELVGILCNKALVLLVTAYSAAMAVNYANATFISAALRPRLGEGPAGEAGYVGFAMLISGVPGSAVAGAVMDKVGAFRATLQAFFVVAVAAMVSYAVAARYWPLDAVFACAAVAGFSQSAIMSAGFEVAAELAFPCGEATVAGFLNASAQLAGVLTISIVQAVFLDRGEEGEGAWRASLALCAVMAMGAVLSFGVGGRMGRQEQDRRAGAALRAK